MLSTASDFSMRYPVTNSPVRSFATSRPALPSRCHQSPAAKTPATATQTADQPSAARIETGLSPCPAEQQKIDRRGDHDEPREPRPHPGRADRFQSVSPYPVLASGQTKRPLPRQGKGLASTRSSSGTPGPAGPDDGVAAESYSPLATPLRRPAPKSSVTCRRPSTLPRSAARAASRSCPCRPGIARRRGPRPTSSRPASSAPVRFAPRRFAFEKSALRRSAVSKSVFWQVGTDEFRAGRLRFLQVRPGQDPRRTDPCSRATRASSVPWRNSLWARSCSRRWWSARMYRWTGPARPPPRLREPVSCRSSSSWFEGSIRARGYAGRTRTLQSSHARPAGKRVARALARAGEGDPLRASRE